MKLVDHNRAAGFSAWRRVALALLLGLSASLAAHAQDLPPLPAPEAIIAQRDAVTANQALAEADRTAAAAALDEAARLAGAAAQATASTNALQTQRDGVPERDKQLHAELEKLSAAAPVEVKQGATLADVEPLLAAADAEYKAAQGEFDAALAEPGRLSQRRKEIPGLQEAARQREREALEALNAPAPAGEVAELSAAKRLAAQAKLEHARAELRLLEVELASQDVLGGLVSLRQEVAKARLTKQERDLKILQEAAGRLRREEALAAAQKATTELLQLPNADPVVQEIVQKLAKDNAALALERAAEDGLAKKIDDATQLLQAETARLAGLREQWNNVRQRVEAGGFGETVGVLLRKQRAELPDAAAIRRAIRARATEAANAEMQQADKAQQRLTLADVEQSLRLALDTAPQPLSQYEKQLVLGPVRKLMEDQRGLIDALNADSLKYVTVLEDLNRVDTELVKVAEEFGAYISENILWIRGRTPLAVRTLADAQAALLWLIDPLAWSRLPQNFLAEVTSTAPIAPTQIYIGSTFVVVLALFGMRRRLRLRLQAIGAVAQSRRETEFSHTVAALACTVFISTAMPLFLGYLGLRLTSPATGIDQATALAKALLTAAWVWWPLEFLRFVLIHGGLAEAHFDWAAGRAAPRLRRVAGWYALVLIPATVVNAIFLDYPDDAFNRSVGCASFLVMLLATGLAGARVSVLCAAALRHDAPDHWFIAPTYRAALARWAVPLSQVGLAGLALSGYYFTALELSIRGYQSVVLLFAALIISSAVRRWLLLARRRIAVEQARRKREALRAEAAQRAEGEGENTGSEVVDVKADDELDILKVDAQSQAAIRIVTVLSVMVSLWFIWVEMVPALNILQSIALWSTVGPQEITQVAEDGTVTRSIEDRVVTITAANMGLALALLVITVLAVRNLPGLLEIALLQRLKMAAGERYATLAVVRYALIGLGITLSFQAIGVGWSKVQWLIAALSVGLGFGMQEIFANFISGLILLFERPIRVGDVVSIGGTSGTVSQIRIRATTITDFDNKDLIVPNKEFVTSKVLNWSLTSPSVRVVLPVGITYGSDTGAALRILLEAAQKHPKVLKEPPPHVRITGFAEKAVTLELRCYSPDIDTSGPLKHELYLKIYEAYQRGDIKLVHPVNPESLAALVKGE